MSTLRFKQVDVFTREPFHGNPLAVVLEADDLTSEQMQRIAAWTNLSETTFLLKPLSEQADCRVRIFTPRQELPFAGHPAVGSAHAALESGLVNPAQGRLRQECPAGILDLTVEKDGGSRKIFVRAPDPRLTVLDEAAARALFKAIGKTPTAGGAPLRVDVGAVWLVADMGTAAAVAALLPDMAAVAGLSVELGAAGISVFGSADDGISALHVRSFAPAQGILEDPVCGSGNASVGAFLRHTGRLKEFGSAYVARQGMQLGRDGRVTVRVDDTGIQIGGECVTCIDGTIRVV